MSRDLTQKLNGSIEDKIDWLITAVQSMDSRVVTRLEGIETRLGTIETRLDNLETRVGNVETRLDTLEIKVDERMKETRPMWEALQAQLTELKEASQQQFAELKEASQQQFAELRESQEKGFRRFDRVMDLVSGDLTRLHGDHVELESRVYKIEKRLNP
jgi:chromosome segregation ATPase